MPESRILVVEDDAELRALLARALGEQGLDVTTVATGQEALARVAERVPDALIIDVGLPDTDGRDLCHALRAQRVDAPVLFLTARDAVSDRLAGFNSGGDDYVTKPFSLAEVSARLQALLRRAVAQPTTRVGELELDPVAHRMSVAQASADLTPTEFRLLAALAARAPDTLRRNQLVRAAWPDGAIVHDNTLDVYVARLRRKLRALPGSPAITTVHGVGYRIA